jgi:putative FmdB family regulatory protein
MPVYEFECQSCEEVHEIWQSLSEAPASACPSCRGPLKKIISKSSFHLKGGGWFADGYSNKPAGKAGSSVPAAAKSDSPPTPACPKTKKSCDTC